MDWLRAVLLGIIEGVTEFLPISSTAHILLAARWMELDLDDPFWTVFAIFIQIGAIVAVVVYFRGRIVDLLLGPKERGVGRAGTNWRALGMLVLASAPVFAGGFFVYDWVEQHLATAGVIAAVLALGGVAIILIERFRPRPWTNRMEQITLAQAVIVGLAQLLSAVAPGTSRAAATIMGGMACGMSRRAATEFSFFLAIPVMFGAGFWSLSQNWVDLTNREVGLVAVGTVVSFFVAWGVIAWLMEYIRRHTFVPFAIYRLVLAAAVAWWLWR